MLGGQAVVVTGLSWPHAAELCLGQASISVASAGILTPAGGCRTNAGCRVSHQDWET